jgi:PAS domain S-box-containing protein
VSSAELKSAESNLPNSSLLARFKDLATAIRLAIPEGSQLSDTVWRQRHRGILALLWLQAIGITCFSLFRQKGIAHSLEEGAIIAAAALVAALPLRPRTVRASIAAFGLIASSAVLVHLSGGYIEFHFHFFVMVGLMALYQEWPPFLIAIAFVLFHHGVVGVLDPSSVYNHPDALAHPWRWAAVHAVFIAAMSIVCLITWRVNETTHALAQLLLKSAGEGILRLDPAGRVTFINAPALALFDWSERQVIGQPLRQLLSRPDGHDRGLETAILGGGMTARTGEESWRRSDGTTVPVEYVRTPIIQRGKIAGTVVVLKDVSDRRRLHEEYERRRRAAVGFAEVGQLISQSLDPHEVSQRIVDSIRTLIAARTAMLYRLDPQTDDLVAVAVSGESGVSDHAELVLSGRVGAAGLAVDEGRGIVTVDVLADPRIRITPELRARVEKGGYRAILAVPLRAQGRVIGAFAVGDPVGRVFDAEDMATAQAFTDQAAIAIENARLRKETEERLMQSETLLNVGHEVSGTMDTTEMMRRVAREMSRALVGDMAGVFLADADHARLRPIAGYHVPKHLVAEFMTYAIPLKGHPILEEAWKLQHAVALDDVPADARVDQDTIRRFPHRSSIFCPLSVQSEPIGGIFVAWLEQGHRVTPAELRLVEGIGRQASIALSNARLVDELKTRQSRLEALLAVDRELSRIQPVESLLAAIAEACGSVFEASSVSFRLLEGDELVLCADWGSHDAPIPTRLKIGESLSGMVAASSEPIVVQDPANDPRVDPAHRESYRKVGVRAFLGVPVKTGDRLVGVLTIRSSRESGFTAADVDMAKAFASQAAIALDNSRLYQESQQAFDELSHTQAQLTQAQKMEAVGQLADGVAHDFNNLLTVISGRSHLVLARASTDDAARRDIELIVQTSERAAALTRQLLAFSRKQLLQPKSLDLNLLAGELAPMLRRLIGEHIELVLVPGADLGWVMADPGQIEQVIMNLVVNARDAMADGGMLRIETGNRDVHETMTHGQGQVPPGKYVKLMVQDAGCGMDSATLTRIFEPFFTTKDPGKGTGLGLATVHGIVHQSGGYIVVDSTVGAGTTSTIYLPRTSAPAEVAEARAEPSALPRGHETVLLVEDETEVRHLAADVLKRCGYAVLETGDPLEALTFGERHGHEVRLLVSDMIMPAMRGPALAERLLAEHPEMRILYMSGYTDDLIRPDGTINPPGAFLQKPFTPRSLARAVRNALDAASAPTPSTSLR